MLSGRICGLECHVVGLWVDVMSRHPYPPCVVCLRCLAGSHEIKNLQCFECWNSPSCSGYFRNALSVSTAPVMHASLVLLIPVKCVKISNLFDTELIRDQTYLILSMSVNELIRYENYEILKLLDTELVSLNLPDTKLLISSMGGH
jgi:hypothetical protein